MPRTADRLTEASLLEHIGRLPHGRASFKQLVKEFHAKGGQREEIERMLQLLALRGELVELRGDQYVLVSKSREYAVGRVNMHRDGYGFVIPDKPVEGVRGDIYISRDEAAGLMNGDRVVARLSGVGSDGKADGSIVRILKRAHVTVVGEFHVRKQGCFVQPHDERIRDWIEIPPGMEVPPSRQSVNRVGVEPIQINGPEDMDGLIVNVEIIDYAEGGDNAIGRVIEVLGRPDDFGIDVEIIIRKHHIPHEFPNPVLEQARSYSNAIPLDEIAQRQDFRGYEIVTIDGETARDFDDAVWVDRLANGNYALHVHIADVSHYIQRGSPIDREAAVRGTSVYFPDRAVPMLPVELSTDICSLRPNEDRLVLSALLELDNRGEVVSQKFTKGVIRSVERMTYTNVHKLVSGDPEQKERYAAIMHRFELMQELALKLNRMRVKRGSIDFDLPEPLIEFDTQGEMIGVVRSPRNIAHRIIEEFMLAANESVAGHLEEAGIPSLYRIHEKPEGKRVADFEEIAAHFGYSLGIGAIPVKKYPVVQKRRDGRKTRRDVVLTQEVNISSRNYQRLIAKIAGKPEERILSYLMLRSLKQARYSNLNEGHFALAAASYTHFTSPIRRYPDLVVHRILAHYLDSESALLDDSLLHELGNDTSFTERRAGEAERELVEWKKVKFMEDRVGDEFDALIISTTKFGFFVELTELFVEGLVPIETLPGDRFLYHENGRKIIGERTRKMYAIGDRVRVRLDRADTVERKLNFALAQPESRRVKRKRADR